MIEELAGWGENIVDAKTEYSKIAWGAMVNGFADVRQERKRRSLIFGSPR